MTDLVGHGITVPLPATWEGRIALRTAAVPKTLIPLGSRSALGGGDSMAGSGNPAPGEAFYPVTHLANFALPADRGDFGSGAVDVMGPGHALIVLVEYGPESAGTALFAARRALPSPTGRQFDPNVLQRSISGQAGFQQFCTVAGRAFCVYVVIGSLRAAAALNPTVRGVLTGVRIEPR